MKFWSCTSISVRIRKTKEIQKGDYYGVALAYKEKRQTFQSGKENTEVY